MKINKEFKIVAAISVLVAIFAVSYLLAMKSKYNKVQTTTTNGQYQTQYNDAVKAVPTVESSSNLDSASKSLDSTDTTQIDVQLKQLDSDTSSF